MIKGVGWIPLNFAQINVAVQLTQPFLPPTEGRKGGGRGRREDERGNRKKKRRRGRRWEVGGGRDEGRGRLVGGRKKRGGGGLGRGREEGSGGGRVVGMKFAGFTNCVICELFRNDAGLPSV